MGNARTSKGNVKIAGNFFNIAVLIFCVLKLSHPGYFLPIVYALEPGAILSTGTTTPQLIRGVCQQTGIKADYVVKYIRASRMSPEASARELVAALIAMELDFNVPQPVVIQISKEFVELMGGGEISRIAGHSVGYNFGNEYKTGYLPVLKDQPLNGIIFAKLAELFAFDVLISNADRRVDNPNLLSNGDDVLVYDHELAFGFVMALPFLRNPQPWLIREDEMKWIRNHYCYSRLRGNQTDFSIFTTKLERLNLSFWAKIETILPPEWYTGQVDAIRSYITALVSNAGLFSTELTRILL